jgi:hypothetical protein
MKCDIDKDAAPMQYAVQLPNIRANPLGSVTRPCCDSALFRHRDEQHTRNFLAEQSAGCNASHTVEARMCRWLLRMRDLTQSHDLKLRQEFLAQMLGVRRTSVSVVAGTLLKAGFVTYRRGNVRLLDVARLEQGACECYETVKGHYARLEAL